MENYRIVLKVNLKKLQTLRTAGFLPELLLVSKTSTTSATNSVRIGSAVCKIDLSGNNSWKIYTTNLF